jgi:hypothetical protein
LNTVTLTPSETTVETPRKKPIITVLFLVIVVAAGVYLRFSMKEHSAFWYDEARLVLHSVGYHIEEATQEIESRLLTKDELQNGYLQPKNDLKFKKIIESVRYDEPGQTPLLHIVVKEVINRFGPDSLRLMAFSVGILTIAFSFWFGLELSGSLLGALVAGALVAVSPFLIGQTQTLTEAAVLPLLVSATCATFLRALKSRSVIFWLLYAIIAVAAVMTSTLIVCTLIAQLLVILLQSNSKFRRGYLLVPKNFGYGILSFLVIGAIYFPFVAEQITHQNYSLIVSPYIGEKVTIDILLNAWLTNPLSVFLMNPHNSPLENCIEIALLSVAIGSFACAWAFGNKKTVSLLVLICLVTAVYFWVPDLVFGGQRTLVTKFWVQLPMCVLVAVSYMVALAYTTEKIGLKLMGPLVLLLVVACQMFSVSQNTNQREVDKVDGQSLLLVSEEVNKHSPATILYPQPESSTNLCQILSLTKIVDSQTKFFCLGKNQNDALDVSNPDNLYVFNPDNATFRYLQSKGLSLAPVEKTSYFYKASKDESH